MPRSPLIASGTGGSWSSVVGLLHEEGRRLPGVPVLVRGNDILTQINGHRADCIEVISRAYLTHADGGSVLPHSVCVRPDPPRPDRFIALAGHLSGDFGVAGIKWIASYPDNITAGRDRASGVLVLNDTRTGPRSPCWKGR
jgi:ornithine cyclodeaminase